MLIMLWLIIKVDACTHDDGPKAWQIRYIKHQSPYIGL
jgi:hypothetical protein